MKRLFIYFLFSIISISYLNLICIKSSWAKSYSQSDVITIENYLNNITSFISYFTQEAEGNISSGKFYLEKNKKKKSGKFRWEYSSPSHIIIVAKNNNLSYYDVDLNEISYASLDDMVAGFLIKPVINLEKDFKIESIEKSEGEIKLTALYEKKNEDGKIILKFKGDEKIYFSGLEIFSSQGEFSAKINFQGVVEGKPIDKKLFIVKKTEEK